MSGSALRRVALRNIAAHKVRLVLSVLAVVLGVTFVTASFAFTTTLKGAFDDIIDESSKGVSVLVSPSESRSPGLPRTHVDTIRRIDGVARVQPQVDGPVVLIKSDGKPYQSGGAPSRGLAYTTPGETVSPGPTLVEGRVPTGGGEVALTREVAEKAGYSLDSVVRIYTTSKGVIEAKLVGYVDLAVAQGGFVGVVLGKERAGELFTDGQHVRRIEVAAADGVSQQELRDRIASELPGEKVQTGDQRRDEASQEMSAELDFVNYFFVAFGFVALLVGSFIIYNTFAMLVAQRLRELGLLRAVGASRGQITRSVLGEALVIGVLGAILGLGAGLGLASLILFGLDAFGFGLPASGLRVNPTVVVVPLVVGLVVTMLSALVPAMRAGRIPPVVALRSIAGAANSSLTMQTALGVFGAVTGVALTVIGTWMEQSKPAAITVGIGALVLVVGTFLTMPALARPLAGGIGRLLGAPFGAMGRLASTNAGRNSRRTAATAFALTLGLMLVAAFGTLATSAKASIGDVVGKGVAAEFMVRGIEQQGPPTPLPVGVEKRIGAVDGVDEVVTVAAGFGVLGGEPSMITAISGPVGRALNPGLEQGTLDPGENGLVVSGKTAREKGWSLGSTVPLITPGGEERTLRVVGVFHDSDALVGPYYTGRDVHEALVPEQMRSAVVVFALARDGADHEAVRAGMENAVVDLPIAVVQDKDQFVKQAMGNIDTLLTIIYALLTLALVVAVLGIVNTLALSVIERRTEVGMLRAVGTRKSQVWSMVILESTQIAIFGALVGAAIGVFLGWAFVSVLESQGLTIVSVPWSIIGIMLPASAVVGVLASVVPASIAARTSPLEAIAD